MISSIGNPNPVTMRKLLDYLAQKKQARIRKAQDRKRAARKNARRQPAINA
jgi:hypothetical protein